MVGVPVVGIHMADVAHGPALAHADGQSIGLLQQSGHIVGLILDPILVAGPAGGQNIFANPFAVEAGGVNAHGSGAEGGLLHGFAGQKGLLEGAGGYAGIYGRGDPESVLFQRDT